MYTYPVFVLMCIPVFYKHQIIKYFEFLHKTVKFSTNRKSAYSL